MKKRGREREIRDTLYSNQSFGRELVVLLSQISMFYEFLVHALDAMWKFECRSFHISTMGAKVKLAPESWLVEICLVLNELM